MPDNENESRSEDEWPPIEEIEALWREDETLARMLLSGYVEDWEDGRRTSKYLADDPGADWKPKERAAREAIARLLRSGRPLAQDFRNQLAALFDPNADTHPAIDRRLIFQRRGDGGRRSDDVRNTAIAQYIHNRMREGDGVEAAQQKAADYFGLSRWTIRDIWSHAKNERFRRLTYFL